MSNVISKRDKTVNGKISGWDKVIADAERHISRLKAAIGHAKEMKESGEPWPGAQSDSHDKRRQHNV